MEEISSKQKAQDTERSRELSIIKKEGGEYDDEDDDDPHQQQYDKMQSFNTTSDTRRTTSASDHGDAKGQTPINMKDSKYKMHANMARFPLRIVWTPLPCIT